MKNGEDNPGRGTSLSGSTGPQCHTAVIWDRQKDAWKTTTSEVTTWEAHNLLCITLRGRVTRREGLVPQFAFPCAGRHFLEGPLDLF